jgi:two-component system response regulator DevR
MTDLGIKTIVRHKSNTKIRTLLVDDHPVTRLGIRSLLETTEDLEVVGEAGDAEEAVRLAVRLQPHLVVLDLRLGEKGDGMEVCRKIKSSPNPPRILIHSAFSRAEDLARATVAGADGYFHKGEEYLEFPGVVRRVCSGERVWFVDAAEEPQLVTRAACKGPALTPKEREVFTLMLKRYSNAEVGRTLYMSLPTVKTHVKHILGKIGLKSRKELFLPPPVVSPVSSRAMVGR